MALFLLSLRNVATWMTIQTPTFEGALGDQDVIKGEKTDIRKERPQATQECSSVVRDQ